MEIKKNPNVDPKRNSSLYFLIGLTAVLMLTYVSIEMKTEDPREEKVYVFINYSIMQIHSAMSPNSFSPSRCSFWNTVLPQFSA